MFRRCLNRMDLSMRDDGLIVFGCITTRADNRVVVGDNRTDWNFASLSRALRVRERLGHEVVDEIWGWGSVHGAVEELGKSHLVQRKR